MVPELEAISKRLESKEQVEAVTVRTFLSWFDAQRRGYNIVRRIRDELNQAQLVTVPDFESRWIDASVDFVRAQAPVDQQGPKQVANAAAAEADQDAAAREWESKDPSHRISKLAAANQGVVSVSPTASLSEAATLLMARDFSQLPIMTSNREVKGVISWKSIGQRLALGQHSESVSQYKIAAQEIGEDQSIFAAIQIIAVHDYALVRNEKRVITGIVTASDLNLQFQVLSEPFLLISEIENSIRNMIGPRFGVDELKAVRNPSDVARPIDGVDDLTFAEYIRLLQKAERWEKLAIAIDRNIFCKDLEEVREIRNDVTHFDPDGITPEQLHKLRDFRLLLRQIELICAFPSQR